MNITKEDLKEYALKLMFEINDQECEALLKDFSLITEHMQLVSKIDNISNTDPMTFPFENKDAKLRSDVVSDALDTALALSNAKETIYDEVKVPKVVGE